MSDVIEINLCYNFNNLDEKPRVHIKDDKIGVIDFETMDLNIKGDQQVYAGGWAVKDDNNINIKMYYLDEFENYDSLDLVKKLFLDILNSKYVKYTFFVHNLANFDYIFILNSLCDSKKDEDFILKPIVKDDGKLVYLKISKEIEYDKDVIVEDILIKKKKKEIRSIILLDSNLFLNNNLRFLCKEFNCMNEKGYFPYKFISKDTLLYRGKPPSFDFFTDLNIQEYYKLFPDGYIYDIKSESLDYLSKDLFSLLDLVLKFNDIIYNNFSLNITSSKTISGLSLNIYLSHFYNRNFNIKMIKGYVESEIRKAYYGGAVILNKKGKLISNDKLGFYYDFNSFYPSMMLKDMPVGNPKLSTSKDLFSYFGFCYAMITPPDDLTNYLIPSRDIFGKVCFPNKPFTGIYFSELLIASLEYGYKIEILGGYKFERGQNVFKEFVIKNYNNRLKAKKNNNTSLQYIYKFILNSLYGRFGMKEIEYRLEIVDKDKAKTLLKTKKISIFNEMKDKYIIKYKSNLNYNIFNFIESGILHDKKDMLASIIKQRGVPSSISIAAAITAYAQMELMKFKNLKDNELFYSDTDSLIMSKELNNDLIHPTELGKLSLEHIIKEGYFISPKFYAFKDINDNIIIRSKGLNKGNITYDDVIKLANGEDLNIKNMLFLKDLKNGTVNIREHNFLIKGLNKNDINYVE